MTIDDLNNYIKKSKEIELSNELIIHTNTGDYPVTSFEYDENKKMLKICTVEDVRPKMYRISYRITKDHKIIAFETIRKSAYSDMDIILDIDELEALILKENKIEGEISNKTGSTIIVEKDLEPTVVDGKLTYKEQENSHYYNCDILEVFRELDDETDTYIRIWKNGEIG